jgi:hypothetical protein
LNSLPGSGRLSPLNTFPVPDAGGIALIRFSCPRCKSILETPDHRAGDKVECPKCQQRLQVPVPPRTQTVLAHLISSTPDPAPLKTGPVFPQAEPVNTQTVGQPFVAATPPGWSGIQATPVGPQVPPTPYAQPTAPSQGLQFRLVPVGLLIIFISGCVAASGFGFLLIAMFVMSVMVFGNTVDIGSTSAVDRLFQIAGVILFVSQIGVLAGYRFCLTIPPRRGTLGLMIATSAVGCFHLILGIVFALVPLSSRTDGMALPRTMFLDTGITTLVQSLLAAGELILFGLFLRTVSTLSNNYRGVWGSIGLIVLAGVAAAWNVLTMLILMLLRKDTIEEALKVIRLWVPLAWVGVGIGVVIIICYLRLVWCVRKSVLRP